MKTFVLGKLFNIIFAAGLECVNKAGGQTNTFRRDVQLPVCLLAGRGRHGNAIITS